MIGFSAAPLILYPTHYVGEPGYFSDTEYTLSFDGKDVSSFRLIKEKELERAKENENIETDDRQTNMVSEKTKEDSVKQWDDLTDTVTLQDQANHGEL